MDLNSSKIVLKTFTNKAQGVPQKGCVMKKNGAVKWLAIMLDPIFLYLAITANILLIAATTAVHFAEAPLNPKINNYFDSLWWGVSTITTIGYGDIVPLTPTGRIIGICLMITGPVLFVLFTGALWRSVLAEQVEQELVPLDKQIRKERKETRQIEIILEEINERLTQLQSKRPGLKK